MYNDFIITSNLIFLLPSFMACRKGYYLSSLLYFTVCYISYKYHYTNEDNINYREYDIMLAKITIIHDIIMFFWIFNNRPRICNILGYLILGILSVIILFSVDKQANRKALYGINQFNKEKVYLNIQKSNYYDLHPWWHIVGGLTSTMLYV